jgi:GDP-L-fucose synthase
MMKKKKIWITGPRGMVGSAIIRKLSLKKKFKILYESREKLNLLSQQSVALWVKKKKPDIVIMTAAKVGGIYANDNFAGEFIYQNIQIQNNIIEASKINNVKKLIFLGSSCIYPRNCKQPIKERYLLTGALEKTNEWYAIAKIAGIKMIQAYRKQYKCNFISLMPCNMYGKGDNYDELNSHVLASLVRKFYFAKQNKKNFVEIWGNGKPLREFMHVDDFADAVLFAMKKYNSDTPLNIGSGQELTISKLAKLISKTIKYKGKIIYNKKFPNGTPRKLLDSSKIKKLGWKSKIKLEAGIKDSIEDFRKNYL